MPEPVCDRCNDTHLVYDSRFEREIMCTSCPTPCPKCRRHQEAYCATTPCPCECHAQDWRYRRASQRRDVRAEAIGLISRDHVLALEAHGLTVVRTERLEELVAGADAALEAAAKRFHGPAAYVVFAGHQVAATLRTMKGGG